MIRTLAALTVAGLAAVALPTTVHADSGSFGGVQRAPIGTTVTLATIQLEPGTCDVTVDENNIDSLHGGNVLAVGGIVVNSDVEKDRTPQVYTVTLTGPGTAPITVTIGNTDAHDNFPDVYPEGTGATSLSGTWSTDCTPDTTLPPTTQPPTTQPPTTQPPTTAPPTTGPGTTAPPTTGPVSTPPTSSATTVPPGPGPVIPPGSDAPNARPPAPSCDDNPNTPAPDCPKLPETGSENTLALAGLVLVLAGAGAMLVARRRTV